MQETKQMANQINEPADLWDLEHFLTQRRKEIDRKYEYQYSQLTHVFGRLLHEQRLREEDLLGLQEDKLKLIRSFATFLSQGRSLTWVLSAMAWLHQLRSKQRYATVTNARQESHLGRAVHAVAAEIRPT